MIAHVCQPSFGPNRSLLLARQHVILSACGLLFLLERSFCLNLGLLKGNPHSIPPVPRPPLAPLGLPYPPPTPTPLTLPLPPPPLFPPPLPIPPPIPTLPSPGLGIRELPVYDSYGQYRFLVCGSGIFDDGSKASLMAVVPFTDSTWCLKPDYPVSFSPETTVTFMVSLRSGWGPGLGRDFGLG